MRAIYRHKQNIIHLFCVQAWTSLKLMNLVDEHASIFKYIRTLETLEYLKKKQVIPYIWAYLC